MPHHWGWVAAWAGLAVLPGLGCAFAAELPPAGQSWWSHVRFLADDRLEGRATGSAGYREAARYVEEQLRRAGAQPAGTAGYLQRVRFQSRTLVESQSSLTLVRDGLAMPLVIGDEATVSLRYGLTGQISAPLVFVGYGLTVPEENYDDFKDLDVRGKIVVALAGNPPGIASALRMHYGATAERWKFLKRAGAVGLIVVQNPGSMEAPWERTKLLRVLPSLVLADPALQDAPDLPLLLSLNPASMDRLLAGSGYTFSEILAFADLGRPLPKFTLPVTLKARLVFKTDTLESANVVAVLPGRDPVLKNEYVVLSAHLDHLGVGEPVAGDRIYNGAMDNAAGVATLIEAARRLQNRPPRRSVLFLAVCGEEKGLLGSRYYTRRPTVPANQLVADLNLDMFLPLYPLRWLSVQGLEESNLEEPLRQAAEAEGVTLQSDPEPSRNGFIRSDQYSFVRAGVPALAFKFGYLSGSPEERQQKEWLRTRYHAPSDDAAQFVDLEAADRFNRIIEEALLRIANQDERPQWSANSFFKQFVE